MNSVEVSDTIRVTEDTVTVIETKDVSGNKLIVGFEMFQETVENENNKVTQFSVVGWVEYWNPPSHHILYILLGGKSIPGPSFFRGFVCLRSLLIGSFDSSVS